MAKAKPSEIECDDPSEMLQRLLDGPLAPSTPQAIGAPGEHIQPSLNVEVEGEHLIVSQKKRLVIRCGDASITLHRDGKIVIRGTQVVSHADGVNRIRGGSVQIN